MKTRAASKRSVWHYKGRWLPKWARQRMVSHRRLGYQCAGSAVVKIEHSWRPMNLREQCHIAECLDCTQFQRYTDLFMVHDALWEAITSAGERKRVLCWTCFEKRLGRPLVKDDLHFCPCTMTHARARKVWKQQ
jgi:hypothetical protein